MHGYLSHSVSESASSDRVSLQTNLFIGDHKECFCHTISSMTAVFYSKTTNNCIAFIFNTLSYTITISEEKILGFSESFFSLRH